MFEIPEQLNSMLTAAYGDRAAEVLDGYGRTRPTTFRVNALKCDAEEAENALKDARLHFEKSAVPNAYILNGAAVGELRSLDIYKQGKIYIQSLSSMLPPFAVKPSAGESILDMAAAPGGKTTQMAAMSEGRASITACEKSPVRAERLKYNLERQGAGKVFVINKDAASLDSAFSFDKILLDAPCSGSGTYGADKCDFSAKLLEGCMRTQKRLLIKAWELLKKGGTLVYSTCSVLPCENWEMLAGVIGNKAEYIDVAHIVPSDAKLLPGVPMTATLCPDGLYEGFFIAALRKPL